MPYPLSPELLEQNAMMPLVTLPADVTYPRITLEGEAATVSASPLDQVKAELQIKEIKRRAAQDRRMLADTALNGAQDRLAGLRKAAQTALILGDDKAIRRLARDGMRVARQIERVSGDWIQGSRELYRVDNTSDPAMRWREIQRKSDQVQGMMGTVDLLVDMADRKTADEEGPAMTREQIQRKKDLYNDFRALNRFDVTA
ncbi:hypothetical protein ACFSM5_16255 [Lacibacterium aquatile]|uniref:Uncharacterized protein n=1 Tax=Lacibacterium aquatile TaxID=1168082 RepID=A0ABW5DTJ5_9PROT